MVKRPALRAWEDGLGRGRAHKQPLSATGSAAMHVHWAFATFRDREGSGQGVRPRV